MMNLANQCIAAEKKEEDFDVEKRIKEESEKANRLFPTEVENKLLSLSRDISQAILSGKIAGKYDKAFKLYKEFSVLLDVFRIKFEHLYAGKENLNRLTNLKQSLFSFFTNCSDKTIATECLFFDVELVGQALRFHEENEVREILARVQNNLLTYTVTAEHYERTELKQLKKEYEYKLYHLYEQFCHDSLKLKKLVGVDNEDYKFAKTGREEIMKFLCDHDCAETSRTALALATELEES